MNNKEVYIIDKRILSSMGKTIFNLKMQILQLEKEIKKLSI